MTTLPPPILTCCRQLAGQNAMLERGVQYLKNEKQGTSQTLRIFVSVKFSTNVIE